MSARTDFAVLRTHSIARAQGVRFPKLRAPREHCGFVDGTHDPKPAAHTLLEACGVSSLHADLHIAKRPPDLAREFRAATVVITVILAATLAVVWFTR